MIKNKFKILGVMLFCLVLSTSSFALLNINFSESLEPGRVAFYTIGEPSTANLSGRAIGAPSANLGRGAGEFLAKALAAPSSNQYAFFADSDPNSRTAYIRVWENAARGDGSRYTALRDYTNYIGLGFADFTVDYDFVRSEPRQAVISQIEEAGIIYPVAGSTLTLTSVQPEVAGTTVEIALSQWEYSLNGAAAVTRDVAGSGQLVLSSAAGDSLNPDDSYNVRVRHQNHWGQWGAWSDRRTHVVGAAAAVGGVETITFNFRRAADGTGINPFSFPLSNVTDPAGLGNVEQLIRRFNEVAGANAVATFGWFDTTAMIPQGYIIIYASDTVNNIERFIPIGGVGAPNTVDLVMDQPYQVYVLSEFAATLTGNRAR
jgi:hypothetical protein